MSIAVARVCSTPGCPEEAGRGGRCARCRSAYDQRRGTPAERGYDAEWRRLRLQVLAEEPYCECGSVTTTVDHVTTVATAPERRLERRNLRAYCGPCHSRKTALRDGRFGENK